MLTAFLCCKSRLIEMYKRRGPTAASAAASGYHGDGGSAGVG